MVLEIIATSVEDAKLAEHGGADRLELVSGMAEGGLTPSHSLIEEVVQAVNIPVNVMVRPHSRSFHYSENDLEIMHRDIEVIKNAGANGVVLGPLTRDHVIDERALRYLLSVVGDLEVTFHRAFDELTDQINGIKILLDFPRITNILTSGGQATAPKGLNQIQKLIQKVEGTPLHILCGSGLTLDNIADFIQETRATEIHVGSAARVKGTFNNPIDPKFVESFKTVV